MTASALHYATLDLIEVLSRNAIDKTQTPYITKLEKRLSKLFLTQGTAVQNKLIKLQSYFQESSMLSIFNTLFNTATLASSADMLDALNDGIGNILLLSGSQLIRTLGAEIDFDLDNPRASEYLAKHGAEMIKAIDDTTKLTLRGILLGGVENGYSYTEIAKQIKDTYTHYAKGSPQKGVASRARLIAVTEIGNGYSEGTLIAANTIQDTGIALQKYWLTSNDKKVSEGCKDNQSAGWIDLDEAFPSGDDRPLRFPGCRCVLQYRRKR